MKPFIFVCKIKLLGYAFATEEESVALKWVEQNPELHYYEKIAVLNDI